MNNLRQLYWNTIKYWNDGTDTIGDDPFCNESYDIDPYHPCRYCEAPVEYCVRRESGIFKELLDKYKPFMISDIPVYERNKVIKLLNKYKARL